MLDIRVIRHILDIPHIRDIPDIHTFHMGRCGLQEGFILKRDHSHQSFIVFSRSSDSSPEEKKEKKNKDKSDSEVLSLCSETEAPHTQNRLPMTNMIVLVCLSSKLLESYLDSSYVQDNQDRDTCFHSVILVSVPRKRRRRDRSSSSSPFPRRMQCLLNACP